MDGENGSIKERPVLPPRTKILESDSEASSGLDNCTEFLNHIARAKNALVQLQKRCSKDRNVDDKEKGRAYKDRENYQLIIQQSVSALLDEVGKFGPCQNHELHLGATETAQMGQPQHQGQTTFGDDQLPTLILHDLRHRLTLENHLHKSQHPPKPTRRMIAPFLAILPVELRQQIYRELLESPRSIRGGDLVEEKAAALVVSDIRHAHQILAIDSTILRTCRKVYEEALPILYKVNHFGFRDVRSLRAFRSRGLALVASPTNMTHSVPAFGLLPNQHGRFSFVRNLSIRFNQKLSRSAAFEYFMYRMLFGQDPRAHAHSEWAELFHGNRCTSPTEHISFPSLETLLLDFSEWGMNVSEGLAVQPFIEVFKRNKPLKSLVVVGLKHAATNKRLEDALVGSLGTFRVGPRAISELDFWDKERSWMSRASWGS